MKRWLVLVVGLGLAGLAGYSLLTLARGPATSEPPRKASVAASAPPPADHIDQKSRDALREILRDADAGEGR